jgi:DNA invertase Pin-like site-specific DNA recombinase
VAYVRVSRVGGRAGDGFLSPELQRESIAGLARREGLEIVETIEELDASGGDRARPGWNRALSMVERAEVAGVAVWNLSRFSRSVRDALDALGRIEDAGGRLWSATETLGDDPTGRMTRNVLLSIAEMERDRARAGFAASASSAVGRGIHVASKIPVGYTRDARPNEKLIARLADVRSGVESGDAQVLDVRPRSYWEGSANPFGNRRVGHIPGAANLDSGAFLLHQPPCTRSSARRRWRRLSGTQGCRRSAKQSSTARRASGRQRVCLRSHYSAGRRCAHTTQRWASGRTATTRLSSWRRALPQRIGHLRSQADCLLLVRDNRGMTICGRCAAEILREARLCPTC